MNVCVVIPWRVRTCAHREAAWERVRSEWEGRWSFHPIDDGGEPFSRAASINLAVSTLDADVYVIADADMLVNAAQVQAAVDAAAAQPGIVVAFDRYAYLTENGTRTILDGYAGSWEPFIQFTYLQSIGGVFATSRETWDLTGGFDPRFRGWGMEDAAFEIASRTLAGPTRKIQGTGWHLFHPLEPVRPAENVDLLHQYEAADRKQGALRALLARV